MKTHNNLHAKLFSEAEREEFSAIFELIQAVQNMDAVTKTPFSEMHPYIARKPLNVISKVIEYLCQVENGIVLDGFMGSGSSLYAALLAKKRAIGIDLNKVAYNLVRTTIKKYNLEKFDLLIQSLLDNVFVEIDDLWITKCSICGKIAEIEREFYKITSDNERPRIGKLELDEIKFRCDSCHPGKKVYKLKKADSDDLELLKRMEIDAIKSFTQFDNPLIQNTRIAIQKGSFLSDYFSTRGKLSTSLLIRAVNELPNIPEKELVLLVISSMVHMLKLGDWKAGSQIPYWRPKEKFTGRNPRKFFYRNYKKIREGKQLLQDTIPDTVHNNFQQLINAKYGSLLFQGDIVETLKSFPDCCIDLIVTDPPYSDQVPYLEYSAAWNSLLELDNLSEEQLEKEIVVSDSPLRNKDKNEFFHLFSLAILEMSRVLKPGSFLAVFYHEFSLKAWNELVSSASMGGLRYVTQVNVGRQFRSVKNVWNPTNSLDGNSLVFFIKAPSEKPYEQHLNDNFFMEIARIGNMVIDKYNGKATSQQLYDEGVLDFVINSKEIHKIHSKYDSLIPIFQEVFVLENGYWITKQR